MARFYCFMTSLRLPRPPLRAWRRPAVSHCRGFRGGGCRGSSDVAPPPAGRLVEPDSTQKCKRKQASKEDSGQASIQGARASHQASRQADPTSEGDRPTSKPASQPATKPAGGRARSMRVDAAAQLGCHSDSAPRQETGLQIHGPRSIFDTHLTTPGIPRKEQRN